MSKSGGSDSTFIEHVQELSNRLLISVLFVGVGSGIGWMIFDKIVAFLSRPLEQTLYYSAPTGELSFVIKVCLLFGIVLAAPVLFYHGLKFLQPAISVLVRRRIAAYSILSASLATAGVGFAYFLSLPLTLEFLLNMQTSGNAVQPLISADEYFNFVLAYIAGFALLFQMPLAVLIINRINPLTPQSLFKSFRFVVLFSFIAAAIITPTPDPINQAIMAIPVIILYFISASFLVISRVLRKKPPVAVPVPAIAPVATTNRSTASNETALPSLKNTHQVTASPAVAASPQGNSTANNNRLINDFKMPTKTVTSSTRLALRSVSKRTYTRPLQTQRIISDFL